MRSWEIAFPLAIPLFAGGKNYRNWRRLVVSPGYRKAAPERPSVRDITANIEALEQTEPDKAHWSVGRRSWGGKELTPAKLFPSSGTARVMLRLVSTYAGWLRAQRLVAEEPNDTLGRLEQSWIQLYLLNWFLE